MATRKALHYSGCISEVLPSSNPLTQNFVGKYSIDVKLSWQKFDTEIRFCLIAGAHNALDSLKLKLEVHSCVVLIWKIGIFLPFPIET